MLDIRLRRASPTIALRTTRSTQSLVLRASFLVLFGFVMFAQHFAAGIHFDTNLLSLLVDHGFKVGALFFPADNCSAFCLSLRSLLHRRRHVRAADSLLFVFSFLRLQQ